MKRLTLLSVSIVLLTNLIYSQSVDVKNGSANTLIQINDEGTTGSITLPSGSEPGTPDSKLYNEGGTLKWSGTTLATGSSLWTLSGGNVFRSTGNVGIGTTNPSSTLSVGHAGFSNTGIYSHMTHENGTAVFGNATAAYGFGIYGQASNNNASAVYGYATHATGTVYGIKGKVNSENGWAGYFEGRGYFRDNVGIGTISPSLKLAVEGSGYFSGNVGIGTTNPSSTLSVGSGGSPTATIYGLNNQEFGFAVYGNASGATGTAIYGQSSSSSGRGIYSYATHSTGANYGIWARTNSENGWAGYFDGRGYFSGNVGIGTTVPDGKLDVHGTVKMLGDWEAKAGNTIYEAPSDGIVIAYLSTGGDAATLVGKTGSTSPPILVANKSSLPDGIQGDINIVMPVKKGDFWKVESTGISAVGSALWIPFGQ